MWWKIQSRFRVSGSLAWDFLGARQNRHCSIVLEGISGLWIFGYLKSTGNLKLIFSRWFLFPCPSDLFTKTDHVAELADLNIIPLHFFLPSFNVPEKAQSKLEEHEKHLGFSTIWVTASWIIRDRLCFVHPLLYNVTVNASSHQAVSIISNIPNKRKLVERCHGLQLPVNSSAFQVRLWVWPLKSGNSVKFIHTKSSDTSRIFTFVKALILGLHV